MPDTINTIELRKRADHALKYVKFVKLDAGDSFAICDELEAARKDLVLQEAAMEARTQAWEAEVERLRGIIANLTSELKKGDERQQLIARQAALAAKGKTDG